jgi:hypothetical protein
MGVGRPSRLPRGVRVVAWPAMGQHTMRRVESDSDVTLGAGVLRLCTPGVAGCVIIDSRCVANGVAVTH